MLLHASFCGMVAAMPFWRRKANLNLLVSRYPFPFAERVYKRSCIQVSCNDPRAACKLQASPSSTCTTSATGTTPSRRLTGAKLAMCRAPSAVSRTAFGSRLAAPPDLFRAHRRRARHACTQDGMGRPQAEEAEGGVGQGAHDASACPTSDPSPVRFTAHLVADVHADIAWFVARSAFGTFCNEGMFEAQIAFALIITLRGLGRWRGQAARGAAAQAAGAHQHPVRRQL